MLRRRPDNTFEYRDIERVLYASAPEALSPERKEALRLRIFSQLGAQDEARPEPAGIARERWIAIPVGVGIAATVIAGTKYVLDQHAAVGDDALVAMASGAVTVDGTSGGTAAAGQRIAASGPSWVAVGENVRVGLEDGAAFRFATSGDRLALLLESGRHHIVSNEALLEVRGGRWAARMAGPGVLEVSIHQWYTSIAAIEGEVVVQHAGSTFLLRAGDPPLLILNQPAGDPASDVTNVDGNHGAGNDRTGPGSKEGATGGSGDSPRSDIQPGPGPGPAPGGRGPSGGVADAGPAPAPGSAATGNTVLPSGPGRDVPGEKMPSTDPPPGGWAGDAGAPPALPPGLGEPDHGPPSNATEPGEGQVQPGADGQSGSAPGQAGATPGQSGSAPGQAGATPGQGGSAPGQAGATPGQGGSAPGHTGTPPGQSGSAPGQAGTTPGQSGSAPGQAGTTPGQSGSAPGHDPEKQGRGQDAGGQPGSRDAAALAAGASAQGLDASAASTPESEDDNGRPSAAGEGKPERPTDKGPQRKK